MRKLTAFIAALLIAGCATVAVERGSGVASLTTRVRAVLDARGLGADGLQVIHNLIHYEGPPPPFSPPLVRELLQDPLASADAAKLFARTAPDSLLRLAHAHGAVVRTQQPVAIETLLMPYLDALAEARRVLRGALPGTAVDTAAILKSLERYSVQPGDLLKIGNAADLASLVQANTLFIDATARFVAALRAAQGQIRFPGGGARFESAIGTVVIGTRGDDAHAAGAALIIDPGGNDSYARAPVTGCAVSIIMDLAGDDRYEGSDVVIHGLAAIVDFAGNDRYAAKGPGLGAAIAGASVLLDMAGDDVYEAGSFAQGAAAFGIGAIIDLGGNDTYRIFASGQGYGMAGGVGLLWDHAGNDAYTAAGMPDVYDRGGGISSAQGAAFGYRTSIGGGIGILRDDAGDDVYTAEMFAQGTGFYYGVGLLWDRAGNDRYTAIRYAQGNGVHEAIGVLRDESGNDSYTTTVGVSQGMGLDLAVGVLYDGGGDDVYRGDALVQGAGTDNGLGIVFDAGGADQWHTKHPSVWGHADWGRAHPTIGILLYDPARAVFVRDGKPYTPDTQSAALGGPLASVLKPSAAPEPAPTEKKASCRPPPAAEPVGELTLMQALERVAPGMGGGKPDAAAYDEAWRHVTTRLRASLAELPIDHFGAAWSFGNVLDCVAREATEEEIESIWRDIGDVLAADGASPFAWPLMNVLRLRPPPAPRLAPMLRQLARHPACSVQSGALRVQSANARDDDLRGQVIKDAQAALVSPCWRLRIAARDALTRHKVSFDANAMPAFLRGASQ